MIELGIHPAAPGAMMYHSTESGMFMAADRDETIRFIEAAKRGDFDGLFADPPVHTSASAAAPAPLPQPTEAEIFDGQQGSMQRDYQRNRAQGRDQVESAARAIMGLT